MGIFTKLTDIINSNIHHILDRAQDPVKMSRLMVQEMEDTLIDLKSTISKCMADQKKVEKQLEDAKAKLQYFEKKAALAIQHDREDLARRIVEQNCALEEEIHALEKVQTEITLEVENYRHDLNQLESKLSEAQKTHEKLASQFSKPNSKSSVSYGSKTMHRSFDRFEKLEEQLLKIEAEAELFQKRDDLEKEIRELENADTIQKKLDELKKKVEQGD